MWLSLRSCLYICSVVVFFCSHPNVFRATYVLTDIKSVNKGGRTSEMLLGEYLVPRLPWKQISKAHHWKCWKVGLPERDRREADWQTQTETAGNKGYYRVAVAWGWRNWGLEGRNTDLGDNCSIYMYISCWWWCREWIGTWQFEDVSGLWGFMDHRHEWLIPHERTGMWWGGSS